MTERDWSDDDARLVAYLDGHLSEADQKTLERDLEKDAALRSRLYAMDIDLSRVTGDMSVLLAEAPSPKRYPELFPAVVKLAAAASIALALLFGGWLLGRQDASEDWRDFAAAYHLLYRTETLSAERVGDGGLSTVSDVLGRDLSPLAELEGLRFRRAQVLGWQDQALIQLAYLDRDGQPFAICIIEAPENRTSVETAQRHGLPTGSFQSSGLQVMVIGAADAGDVDDLTKEVSRLF